MCIAIYLYTFFCGHIYIYMEATISLSVCIHQKVSLFIFVYLIVCACKCFQAGYLAGIGFVPSGEKRGYS